MWIIVVSMKCRAVWAEHHDPAGETGLPLEPRPIGRRAILSSAASVVIHYARRLRSPDSGDRASILRVMQRISLDALATQQLELAAAHGGRPAADTVVGGHERVLRQTVVGMIAGTELGEHNNPGEATVHVLRGRVRLTSGGESWEGRPGDLLKVPNARHGLQALEDSAILLTVAKLP